MPAAAATILSGTRDELGGVDIGIANVYERDERPGVLSLLLVTPDGQHILAAGDSINLGGRRFTLRSLELQSGGAYRCGFEEIAGTLAEAPATPSTTIPLSPQQPSALVATLRVRSERLLAALGWPAGSPVDWEHSARDTYHREWNGEETGPITNLAWTARLAGAEARIGLDLVRYNPDQLYRADINGFWKAGERHASLFARADGDADLTEAIASGDIEAITAILAG